MLAKLPRDFSKEPMLSRRFASCFASSAGGWANVYEAIRGDKGFGGVAELLWDGVLKLLAILKRGWLDGDESGLGAVSVESCDEVESED
jgi:hypothetical protein